MKLVTYTHGAIARPGLLVTSGSDLGESTVLDLVRAIGWVDGKAAGAKDERTIAERFGDSVLGFIEKARDARPLAVEALAAYGRGELPAKTDAGAIALPAKEVTLLAPI